MVLDKVYYIITFKKAHDFYDSRPKYFGRYEIGT